MRLPSELRDRQYATFSKMWRNGLPGDMGDPLRVGLKSTFKLYGLHFPMFLQLWVDGGSKGGGKGEGKPSPTAFGRKGSRDFDQGSTDF